MAEPGWRDRLLAAAGTRLQAWGAHLLARATPEARAEVVPPAGPGTGPPEHWLALLDQSEIPLDWQGVDAAAWERADVETLARWRLNEPRPGKAAPSQQGKELAPETARRRRPPPSVQFEPPAAPPPEAPPDFGPTPASPTPPRVVFAGWETPAPPEPDLPAADDRPPRPPAEPPAVIEQAPTSRPAPPSWPERPARQSRPDTAPEPQPGARSPKEPVYGRPPERAPASPPAFTKPAARVAPQPRSDEHVPGVTRALKPRNDGAAPARARPLTEAKPRQEAAAGRGRRAAARESGPPVSEPDQAPLPDRAERPPRALRSKSRRPRSEPATDLFGDSPLPATLWPDLPETPAPGPAEEADRWQALLREQRGTRR